MSFQNSNSSVVVPFVPSGFSLISHISPKRGKILHYARSHELKVKIAQQKWRQHVNLKSMDSRLHYSIWCGYQTHYSYQWPIYSRWMDDNWQLLTTDDNLKKNGWRWYEMNQQPSPLPKNILQEDPGGVEKSATQFFMSCTRDGAKHLLVCAHYFHLLKTSL